MNILKKLKESYIHWWHLPIGEKYAVLLVIIVTIATLLALMFVSGCAGHVKNKICWLCKGWGGYCVIHSSERQSECPWPTHPKCPNCGKERRKGGTQ